MGMSSSNCLPGRFVRVLAVVAVFAPTPAPAQAPSAPASTPGLVLATEGRTAPCDVLTFSPDGQWLMATGDDKVVRRWVMAGGGFSRLPADRLPPLRWPILRERSGSIFAM